MDGEAEIPEEVEGEGENADQAYPNMVDQLEEVPEGNHLIEEVTYESDASELSDNFQ